MHSKQLRQALQLTIDTAGMRGHFTKREVIQPHIHSKHWSVADEAEAKIAYLMGEATHLMSAPLSNGYLTRLGVKIPEEVRALLGDVPANICVARRGGPGSPHVATIKATREDWANYISLKNFIVNRTTASRDRDQDILNLLISSGVETLEEYLTK